MVSGCSRHNGGGDSLGVISAVRWTISNFNANTSRVYAVGTSSGAMMTNVLIGAYPGLYPRVRGGIFLLII